MSRAILLLPDPDVLQLANCHKYVQRVDRRYADIYTMTTIVGNGGGITKLLVIGHGGVGMFVGVTIDELVDTIVASGMPLTNGGKIAFDTCYAGSRGDAANVTSALHAVRVRLKQRNFDCNLELVGATGPSVTIGELTSRRLVVKPSRLAHAGGLQMQKMLHHGVDTSDVPQGWREDADSAQIKIWAQREYAKLIAFANDFRKELTVDLDTSSQRKVKLQV